MQLNINLNNLNKVILPKFYPLMSRKERNILLRGGAGSGKSVFFCQLMLLRILLGYKQNIKHRFLVVRKTSHSIRESVYSEIKKWLDVWNMNSICEPNKSNMSFQFSNKSEIISTGMDSYEKIKSLSGITSIMIEEANQLTLNDFRQLNLRLRGIKHTKMQLVLAFNPVSKLNWLFSYFYEKERPNTILHHSTYLDNKFLDKTYIEELEDLINQDQTYHDIYALGKWGTLSGTIYKNYKVIKDFPEDKYFKEIIYGIDFAYNVETAVVQVGKKIDDFYAKELLYKTKLTNEDLIKELKRLIPKRYRNKRVIYADNAEPNRIEEINRAGFICLPADKSVTDGLDFCKRHKLYISQDSENMVKEISGYIYKKDKDGNTLEIPVKFRDHLMDAWRYSSYTHWKDPVDTSILVYSGSVRY